MLVLTRREGERVVIGDPSNPIGYVSCEKIRGDRVRLGFEFAREIPVYREEVARAIAAGSPQGATKSDGGVDRGTTTPEDGPACPGFRS